MATPHTRTTHTNAHSCSLATHTHTHTHTHLRRSAPGARRAAAAHLVEGREASSRRRRRPLRALWRLRAHPGARSPQLCLVCHDCMSMPSGNALFEACGPALVLTPIIRPKRRRTPWPAGTKKKRTHKAPVGQFRGEATPGSVLGASPVVNVSSRASGLRPPHSLRAGVGLDGREVRGSGDVCAGDDAGKGEGVRLV